MQDETERRGEDAMDAAIAWQLRLVEAEADWGAFIDWLDASPAHAEAYRAVALADRELGDDLVHRPANEDDARPDEAGQGATRAWRRWGAIAAGLVAVAAGVLALDPASRFADRRYPIETAPGMRREVVLADGSRIQLDGGTRLLLDRRDSRRAELVAGEARFAVVHDARHPFEVRSGDAVIRDVGTAFDVARHGGRLRVAVAEGAVTYQPDGEAVLLRPGMRITARDDADRLTLDRVEPATVSSWRENRLSYRGEPLSEIAADVSRATGHNIQVDATLRMRTFSGTLQLDGRADRLLPRLEALLDVRAARTRAGWMLREAAAMR